MATDKALTPKQEAFCIAYLKTGNASEAYRQAYDAGGMTAASVNRKAKEVLDNVKITARLAELRKPAADKAKITLESHLDDLRMLRNAAVKDKKWDAAVKAEVARGRAAGIYIERHEVTGKGGGPMESKVEGGANEEQIRAIVNELRGEFLGGDSPDGD